ncbi:MAG: prepilin peptidase, partial [Patescibacteria group bacterium]
MEIIFVFLFGLMIGSFLNAVMYRLHSGESIVFERSHCPRCGHVLAWYELVPLASFFIQRGRCRACGMPIAWQYPLVELATGISFVFLWQHVPSAYHGVEIAYLFFVAATLVVIFVFDLKWYIIPNRILYPLVLVVLSHVWWGLSIAQPPWPLWSASGVTSF